MKEVKLEKCPYCGGTEFVTCRVKTYGSLWLEGSRRATVLDHAVICRGCGSLVRAYIESPETQFAKSGQGDVSEKTFNNK